MSGHSKWTQIKRKKEVSDTRKGAVFTKLGKNIIIAAKLGKDPTMNPQLRAAIDAAKAANMPKDNIEKAILKGAGELPGVTYEEVRYEAYGPGGVALLVECITDNTNRTVSEIRSILSKHGGTLASTGSVLYMFAHSGVVRLSNSDLGAHSRDDIELLAIDAGADDIRAEDEGLTIITNREHLGTLTEAINKTGITPTFSGIEWIAATTITLSNEDTKKIEALLAALDEQDDVDCVATNTNI